MITTDHTDDTPTVTSCPAWCEQPAGHSVMEDHEVAIDTVQLDRQDPVEVSIGYSDDLDGPPLIMFTPGVDGWLTATDARRLAAALTAAADRLDQISAAARCKSSLPPDQTSAGVLAV